MGDLIAISRPKPLPVREFLAGHSAEILFFTGVRYYRMAEAVEPLAVKLGAHKRRRSPEQRVTAKRLREERRLEALA